MPLFPTSESVPIFLKIGSHPRFDSQEHSWAARPIRELDATNEKKQMLPELNPMARHCGPSTRGSHSTSGTTIRAFPRRRRPEAHHRLPLREAASPAKTSEIGLLRLQCNVGIRPRNAPVPTPETGLSRHCQSHQLSFGHPMPRSSERCASEHSALLAVVSW